ncbi:MAG: hypothetical protein Q8R90_02215 [Bacteroidales bacterium]|nr:hypothetical protein [Bacteroidales bacterium]
MLNDNKISEIIIILDGLQKDIQSLSETEMISHIKWEELLMSGSMIIHKLNTLRIEQERNYVRQVREEAEMIHSKRDGELRAINQSMAELRRSVSDLSLNLSKSIVPELYKSKDKTSVTLTEPIEEEEKNSKTTQNLKEEIKAIPDPDRKSTIIESDLFGNQSKNREEEMEFEFIEERRPLFEIVKGSQPEWMKDIPGPRVSDLHMAVTLNDKIYFIKELFASDEEQFKLSIQKLNEMETLAQALEYTRNAFPSWDEESSAVYRFYMLLRRRYNV